MNDDDESMNESEVNHQQLVDIFPTPISLPLLISYP